MQMRCDAKSACVAWEFAVGCAVTDFAVAPDIASKIIEMKVSAFIVIS